MGEVSTGKKFDYAALTAEQRSLAKNCAHEIHDFRRKTTRDAIRIGRELRKVKAALEHGQFLKWVNAEFDWSTDTAERLMKVADRFGKNPHAADIALTALYLLAGDKVPEEARREALERAEGGESITPAVAREITDKYRVPTNSTGDALAAGEVPFDTDAPPVSGGSADIGPEPTSESPSDTTPADIIATEVAVSSADTAAAIPQEIDVCTGVQGEEKPITMPDLEILMISVWSLVAGGDADIGPAVRRTTRGWPAERRAKLARQADAFGRLMTAASGLLARPPRVAPKDGEQEAGR